MKIIRKGNDIFINWTITRYDQPEDFSNKDVTVKLLDAQGVEQDAIEYIINNNIIEVTFWGKDQVTTGKYRLLLQENAGQEDMITIDAINAFCLTEILDGVQTIETAVVDVRSDINYNRDLSQFATKTYVDGMIAEVTDEIPVNTSDLNNDSGFVTENDLATVATTGSYNDLTDKPVIPPVEAFATKEWVQEQGYADESDLAGKADASTVYTKSETDGKLAEKADKSEIPTNTSDLNNDSGFVTSGDLDGYATQSWVESQGYADESDLAGKADASTVYTKSEVDTKLSGKADSSAIPTKTSDLTNDSGFIDTTALATLFNDADYDSSTKRINFKHGQNILAYIDATAFIKDGMVDSVVIENGYVVITFNTDAGKEAIRIDITEIFNPENYYDKTAVDGLLAGKQNVILDLNQIRLDASAGAIAYGWGNHASAGYATQTWVENQDYLVANDVSTFVDASVVYTKSEVDTKLGAKADSADLSTVATSGSYNDLTDKPVIPSLDGYATEQWVENKNYLVENDVSTFITENDASVFLVVNDVSTFIDIADVSSGFEVKAWRGTQAEYDALTVIEQNKLYIILPATN